MGAKKQTRRTASTNQLNKQEKVIQLSLEGMTWTEIAKEVGITTQGLWKWRQSPKFQIKLVKAQEAVMAETASRHAMYVSVGFKVLYEQAINKDNKYSHKMQHDAALQLIQMSHRNVEVLKIVEQNRRALEALFPTEDE